MALKHDSRHILLSRCSFTGNNNIACRIGLASETAVSGKLLKKSCHLLLVTRFTWNFCDFLENLEY